MDNRYKRLGKNTVLVFLGGAGSKLIGLLMLPFYTRFLTKSEFGVSDLILTYSNILVPFITCCVADAIFIFPKDEDRIGRSKFFTSGLYFIFLTFCICGLVFWGLDLSQNKFHINGTFFQQIWWLYAIIISTYFQNYTQQFTRSIDKMVTYSVSGVVLTLSMAITALLLLPKYGLTGYLWSIVLSNIIAGVYSLLASGGWKYISLSAYDFKYLKKLLLYGIPLIPNGVMWWIVNGINRPVMEHELGLAAIGVYSVASRFPNVLNMLFTIFSNAWGISMLEEFGKPDFNKFFNRTVKYLFFVIIIGGCIMVLCSKLIIRIFAAPEFFEAWKYVPLLTLSVILQCMSGLIGGVFMAEKKSKYFFYSSVFGALTSALLTYPCVRFLGLMGVPIAVAISFLCMTIVRLKYAWKHINMIELRYFGVILLAYIAFIVVYEMEFGLLINVGSFIAICTFIIVISKSEIETIMNVLSKKIFKRK